MAYYSMYHISLALLFKVGIKSENHSGTIRILKNLFDLDNSKIKFAKKERIDKQYYTDFKIKKNETEEMIIMTELFCSEIIDFIEKLNTKKISYYIDEFKNTYFK